MKLELKDEYLADENERAEAKAYFLDLFQEGATRSLKITVGPYKDSGIEKQLEQYLDFKLGISGFTVSEKGWLSRKRVASFITIPITITPETMEDLANAFYDVILAFDVKVDVEEA